MTSGREEVQIAARDAVERTREASNRTAQRGVRRLTAPVHAHILDQEKPRHYEAFMAFRCGDPASKAVGEVQLTARRLYEGATELSQTPVVLEDSEHRMVGFCSVHTRPPGGYPGEDPHLWIAERYIVAFGRDLRYRRRLLRDNTTWVGEAVIRAALDMIVLEAGAGPMPAVSALVRPLNKGSSRVLEGFGFESHPTVPLWGQNLLWRKRGLPPPPELDPDAYLPPQAPVRIGRNDPCWCGSGRKLKRCHGS